jgi:OPT family small oligopeptide transporter
MNQIGSGSRGLGVLSFSLDWNTIVGFMGSPLITPFWAAVNNYIGFICVCWILIPVGYYSNIWDAQTFPVLSSKTFKTDGTRYDPLDVMKNGSLDEELYKKYGQLRMSFFFAISYGVGFATLSAVLVHTLLYHGKEILARFKDARSQDDDIHAKLMDRYEEVPDWWYGIVFLINMALSVVVCEVYDINLPWWGVLLAIGMAAVFLVPIGIITAIANTTPGLNIITEFVIGYILPGRPIANVTFKTYGYISMYQAIIFLADLKLGHYMKIPPKEMFVVQTVGTVVAGLMNVATAYMMYHLIPDICISETGDWQCSSANVFYSASVIWGVIGPAKMFGPGSYYFALMWWFLIGALVPIPFWLLSRKYPNSFWKYVHTPVILGATAIMPPAQPVMYTSWFILAFVFQFYMYRYRHGWWSKFNYVLSAAMDSGVAVSGIAIFFAFQYWGTEIAWWGTEKDCPNFHKL